MITRYPSLTSLRAFEAVSRHLSFTHAALELNITQTAVSHQIKALEELLGAKLFVRKRNKIELTDVAKAYYGPVRSSLIEVSAATEGILRADRQSNLTIASPQTFATMVLLRYLDEFRSLYPGIRINLRTLLSLKGLVRQDQDLAISYGPTSPLAGWRVEQLTHDEMFPVCSPKLLKLHKLKTPDDLASHTGIRNSSPLHNDTWPTWLRSAGVPDLRFKNEIVCDRLVPAIQAAINGLGVVMGRRVLIERELASGELIEPFKLRHKTGTGYFLICPEEHWEIDKVKSFRKWLVKRCKSLQ